MISKGKTFWQKNWLTLAIVSILMLVAIAMCFLLATTQPTPRESALETLILTVFSFTASYLVSKIFAEMSYSQTLRDNGVQIASGIIVLKRQIENLSEWTGQKRIAFKRDEPVEAAFEHVQNTLNMFRDMNNAALGGIAGVIGDALAQYETVMMQVSKIRGNALEQTTEIEKKMQLVDSSQVPALQSKIQEINETSEKRIEELSRQTVLPIPAAPARRKFRDKCPYCGGVNEFEMVDKPGQTRTLLCSRCGGRFNAHIGLDRVFTRPHGKLYQGSGQAADRPAPIPTPLTAPAPVPGITVLPPPPPAAVTNADARSKPVEYAVPNPVALEAEKTEPLIGTTTFKDALLASKTWIYGDQHKEEARSLLLETQGWVDPRLLKPLVELLITADQRLRGAGMRRTANALQSVVFNREPSVDAVSNSVVRMFVKMVLSGGGLKFGGPIRYSVFATEYVEDLSEQTLLAAYARGCVRRLQKLRPLAPTDSRWLAELLFGKLGQEWEQLIERMLSTAENLSQNTA